MKKFLVCNVDWLVWMMSMSHDAVFVYTSNRQDKEDIYGHDSTNWSELCFVMTLSGSGTKGFKRKHRMCLGELEL